ncbi:MAG: hypothetical protein J2P46_02160, partial [Zavarzinella sp.]|nr:hypothetical protein [Zavarzinella sp.]
MLVATLGGSAGCRKTSTDGSGGAPAGQAATTVSPVQETKSPTGARPSPEVMPSDRDVPVNLSSHLIPGEMGLPEGATVERGLSGSRVIRCGKTFVMEIAPARKPLAETKAAWGGRIARLVADEPNTLFAELREAGANTFAFDTRVKLGETEYRLRTPDASVFTQAQADRMLRSAKSLRQTDSIKAALQRDAEAVARLERLGCQIIETGGERELVVTGDQVSDDDLAGATDLMGLSAVRLRAASKITARGLSRLEAVKTVHSLTLTGPAITDDFVTSLKPLPQIDSVAVEAPNLSDAGLAFLSGFTGLRTLSINGHGSAPTAPRITGQGFVHLTKLPNLAELTVREEPVEDAALEHLGAVRSLRELRLDRVRVTDAGLRFLESLPALEHLSLTRVRVRGEGLSVVGSLPKLRTLGLTRSAVT